MKVITTTYARAHFQDIINSVHYTKKPILITKKNKPWVMIESLPENDATIKELITLHKNDGKQIRSPKPSKS